MPSRESLSIAKDVASRVHYYAINKSAKEWVLMLACSIDELRVRDLGEVLELCAFEDQFIIDLLRNKLAALKSAMGDEGRTA